MVNTEAEWRKTIHLNPFGAWVQSKTHLLATGGKDPSGIRRKGYLSDDDSYARKAIAKLARSAGHDVGADPDIFEWTLEGMPESVIGSLQTSDGPSKAEKAAHTAITLFAVHQKSEFSGPMYTDQNYTLGYSVGKLSQNNLNEAGVHRRFDKVQTASNWKELTRHARALVQLLKQREIPLNYGLLAQDLVKLNSGNDAANEVRLRWGRDFIRAKGLYEEDTDGDTTSDTATPETK